MTTNSAFERFINMDTSTFEGFIGLIRMGMEFSFHFRDNEYAISQNGKERFMGKKGDVSVNQDFVDVDDMVKNLRIEGLTLEKAFPEFTHIM